jgi:hypothetical protein
VTVQPHVRPWHEAELAELYASYKQLVLGLAAGLIFKDDLDGLGQDAVLLRDRSACAVAAATPGDEVRRATASVALAAEELVQAVDLVRRGRGDADEALDRVRERHRSLRRQVWRVLPFEYPSCGGEHSHGRSERHAHPSFETQRRSEA